MPSGVAGTPIHVVVNRPSSPHPAPLRVFGCPIHVRTGLAPGSAGSRISRWAQQKGRSRGLEPPTPGITTRCSNQLSYDRHLRPRRGPGRSAQPRFAHARQGRYDTRPDSSMPKSPSGEPLVHCFSWPVGSEAGRRRRPPPPECGTDPPHLQVLRPELSDDYFTRPSRA